MAKKVYPSFAALSAAFSIACCQTARAQSSATNLQPTQQTTTSATQSIPPPPNVSAWEAALQSPLPGVRAKALATIPNIFGWDLVSGSLRMRLNANGAYLKGQAILAPILADYMMAEVSDFRGERGEQAAAMLAAIGPTATHVALPTFLICLSRYPSPHPWGPRSFNADDYGDKISF